MKKIFAAVIFVSLLVFPAFGADESSTILQMDKAEMLIYGELQRGGLIDRLNSLESVLFGRSLPGSIAERQQALLNFIQIGTSEQPSLLFKIGVGEWSVSQVVYPSIPALGRIQKLEQDLEGAIQEGKPLAMRVERILSMLLTDPVIQKELEISSDIPIKAQLLDSIGPGKSKKGDIVKVGLTEDIVLQGMLVAPKGSRVIVEIAEVQRPGSFGRPGEVRLDIKYLEILGPEQPKLKLLDSRKDWEKGEKNIAVAAGASMFGAVLLGPLGLASGLLIRGDAINIDSGTQVLLQFVERTRVSAFPIPSGLSGGEQETTQKTDDGGSGDLLLLPPANNPQ